MSAEEKEGAESLNEVAPADGLSEEDFSSLLESLQTFAPILKGLGGVLGGKRSDSCAARETFLLSLKPYLSPARCEAVDYLVRIARIGDAIRSIR